MNLSMQSVISWRTSVRSQNENVHFPGNFAWDSFTPSQLELQFYPILAPQGSNTSIYECIPVICIVSTWFPGLFVRILWYIMNLFPIWIHLLVAQTVFWRSSMFLDSVHFHSSSFWFNDHHLSLFLLFISCSPLINPHQLFQPNRHARSLESLFYHQKDIFIRFSDISIEKGAFYHHLCSDQR